MSQSNKECAKWAITVLTDLHITSIADNRRAVIKLLDVTDKKDLCEVASFTVERLLTTHPRDTLALSEAISLALSISVLFPITIDSAKHLVRVAAREGFHSYFPQISLKLLSRLPNLDEVSLLVAAYTGNKATRSSHVEERLEALVRSCVSADEQHALIVSIEQFEQSFRDSISV